VQYFGGYSQLAKWSGTWTCQSGCECAPSFETQMDWPSIPETGILTPASGRTSGYPFAGRRESGV